MKKSKNKILKAITKNKILLITIFAFIFLFSRAHSIFADTTSPDGFVYTTTIVGDGPDCTADITGYTGAGGDAVIPDTLDGCPVTSIGDYAFSDTGLTSIVIPDSVTSIGSGAFASNINMASVTLGNGVISIGDWAFYETGLTSIVIPDNVTTIDVGAFAYNTNMTSITIGSGVISIGDQVFENTGIANIVIPDSVTTIGISAFADNIYLASVTLGSGVISIGDSAFSSTKLTNVVFPDTVTSIGIGAFQNDPDLKVAHFLGDAPTMGTDVFLYSGLPFNIYYIFGKNGFTNLWNSYTTTGELMNTTSYSLTTSPATLVSLTSATLNGSITTIIEGSINPAARGFQYGLTESYGETTTDSGEFSVESYSNDVSSLACGATYHYRSYASEDTVGIAYGNDQIFTTVDCPFSSEFTYIITSGEAMITGYTGVGGAVTIPDTLGGFPVTSIRYNSMQSTQLTSLIIPDSVTTIDDGALSNNPQLLSINIGSGVTDIGMRVFVSDPSLTQITVDPSNLNYSSIDGVLFSNGEKNLFAYPQGKSSSSYTIPSGVTSIETWAFDGNTSLTSLTIPSSVSICGNGYYNIFYSNTSLTQFIVDPGNLNYSSINGVLFSNDGKNLFAYPEGKSPVYTVPSGVTSIGSEAFMWNISITSITIPDSVTSIGDQAFSLDTALTNLIIGKGLNVIGSSIFFSNTSLVQITVDPGNPNFSSIDGVLFSNGGTNLVFYPHGKSSLYNVPSGVTSIDDQAFISDDNLINITLPDGLTSIGKYAFNGAQSLASITIPSSVTNIGEFAFSNTYKISTVYFLGSNSVTMGDDVFLNPSSLFKIYYTSGKEGFSNPWYTYPTEPITAAFSLSTSSATSLTLTTATLNGSIDSIEGEITPTSKGFQYGQTLSYEKTTEVDGPFTAGLFKSDVSGLSCGTYHYRSYAQEENLGIAFGNDQTFTLDCEWTSHPSAGARRWSSITSSADGMKLAAVNSRDNDHGAYIYTSIDGGATWTEQTNAGARYWNSIASSADGTKLAAADAYGSDYNGGYIYTSTDSGATWTKQIDAGAHRWSSITSSADGNKLAATDGWGNDVGYIYTSTDGGTTWTEQTNAGARYWYGITSSADGMKLAAVDNWGADGNGGYIYTSADSGATWKEQTDAGARYWSSIASSADGTKLVAVDGNGYDAGYIYTSADSGETWTAQTSAGLGYWISIASSSDGTKLAAVDYKGADGNGGYIYISTDSGVKWIEKTNVGARYWASIISSADGDRLAAADAAGSDNNGGYIYTSKPDTVISPTEPNKPDVSVKRHTSSGSSSTIKKVITPTDQSIIPIASLCSVGEKFNTQTGALCSVVTVIPNNITKTLKLSMTNNNVKTLQIYLNTHGFVISATGAGSVGKETTYFGSKTKLAVIKFQIANGLKGDGVVGALTRALLKM